MTSSYTRFGGGLFRSEELVLVASLAEAAWFSKAPRNTRQLVYCRHATDWTDQGVWLRRKTQSKYHNLNRKLCQNYTHAIGRALMGERIALISCTLLNAKLAFGRISLPIDEPMATRKGNSLVRQRPRDLRPSMEDFTSHRCQN